MKLRSETRLQTKTKFSDLEFALVENFNQIARHEFIEAFHKGIELLLDTAYDFPLNYQSGENSVHLLQV